MARRINNSWLRQVQDVLSKYGYAIDADGYVYNRSGKRTDVKLSKKGPRMQARQGTTGALLWSGSDVGDFLRRYWHAEPLPAPVFRDPEDDDDDEDDERTEADDDDGPAIENDDFVIQDARGQGFDVHRGGKHFGHYDSKYEAVHACNREMDREQFWPNLWYVNDHGNSDLLNSRGGIVRSWV